MHYGKKFPNVVGPHGCLKVEQLCATGHIHSLVFHHSWIAATSCVDGYGIELGLWPGNIWSYRRHSLVVNSEHRLSLGLSLYNRSRQLWTYTKCLLG